jgi:hypothetical protein
MMMFNNVDYVLSGKSWNIFSQHKAKKLKLHNTEHKAETNRKFENLKKELNG